MSKHEAYTMDRALDRLPLAITPIVSDGLKTILIAAMGTTESEQGDFVVDAEAGKIVQEAFERLGNPIPVDYEHHSEGGDYAAPDGTARAAGWIEHVYLDRTRGLLGLVKWTDHARELIRADEYRYVSPVMTVRKSDRKVVRLHSVALTNRPATPHAERVAASRKTPELETEIEIMADEPAQGADRRKQGDGLQGKLRTLIEEAAKKMQPVLVEAGVELGADATAIDILKTGLKALGSDDATEDRVSSSLKKRLGLDAEASEAEVLLALTLIDTGASSEVTRMRAVESDREAKELVDRYVAGHVINPNDTEQYRTALSLARENPQRFEALVKRMCPAVATGRTNAPAAQETNRSRVIASAARTWRDEDTLQKLTGLGAYCNSKLIEEGLATLEEDEVKTL